MARTSRTAAEWIPCLDSELFAEALAPSFAVHVVDRRGRGGSGPQGEDYSIERELEDLLAVRAQTDARIVFGHSYGGLIALEAARRSDLFSDVVVYEPGLSVARRLEGAGRSIAAADLPRQSLLVAA